MSNNDELYDCAMRYAFKDIANYITESNIKRHDGLNDVWICTPGAMTNKEIRLLNYQLGINKINHIKGDYYAILKDELFNNDVDDID